jgi:hypothetical protein
MRSRKEERVPEPAAREAMRKALAWNQIVKDRLQQQLTQAA